MRSLIILFLLASGMFIYWLWLFLPHGNLGAVLVTEIPDKVIIDYQAFAVFKDNKTGEHITVPFTKIEHDALAQKNAPLPQKNGYTWISSGLTPIYAPSTLINNQYYKVGVDSASTTLVKIHANNKEGVVPVTDIVNGELTATGLSKLQ